MGASADLKVDPDYNPGRDELGELRALLLGQQIVELQRLRERLDDPEVRADEVSRILGRAIALATKENQGLQRSFYPIVEQALKISVAKNPGILTTSLAPIIGETVRKAVANAFRNLVDSINVMVERSFSWKALMWRLEALRTGKSFGEIVVLRSLNYKVQQVFLFQRQTGAVLQYVAAPGEGISEAELAASMLTAIGDFVSDAFAAKHSQELGVVQTDDFTLWIHHGPQALLAATIIGTPPPELKNVFAREDELIHKEFAAQLASFKGDASIFDGARPHLQKCLLGHSALTKKKSRAFVLLAALVVILAAACALAYFVHRQNSRWQEYLAKLGSEPGIVVTSAERSWGHYSIAGLRDPLAADPQQLASQFSIPPGKLSTHFEPYESLDSGFVEQREFDAGRQFVEEQMILFPVNSSALAPEQQPQLEELEDHLNQLAEMAHALGREIRVNIYGRADQTGAESKNVTLSQQRADRVRDALIEHGIAPEMMTAVGLGDSQPVKHGSAAHQLEVNRSVTMKVAVSSEPGR